MSLPDHHPVSLNNRDIAIILACLRIGQEEGMARLNDMPQIAMDLKGEARVDPEEIDELCERINLGG